MGIGSALKKLASTAERIAYTEVRGTDKVKAAVRRGKAAIERERIKRKAAKAAKDEQKYQDFEREYGQKRITVTRNKKRHSVTLSAPKTVERDIERTKDEIEDIKEERRSLSEKSQKDSKRKSAFSWLEPEKPQRVARPRRKYGPRDPPRKQDTGLGLDMLIGPAPTENRGRSGSNSITNRTASGYSFHNILDTGSTSNKKGGAYDYFVGKPQSQGQGKRRKSRGVLDVSFNF